MVLADAADLICPSSSPHKTVFLCHLPRCAGSDDVAVGAPLALVVENKADIAAVQAGDYSAAMAAFLGGSAAPAAAAPAPAAAAAAAPAPSAASSSADVASSIEALDATDVFPSARLLMAQHGVNPGPLAGKGSGKGGRITKGDVLVHMGKIDKSAVSAPSSSSAAAPAPAPAAAPKAAAAPAPVAAKAAPVVFAAVEREGGTYKDTKPSTVRKVIASRLTESKAKVPHQYALMECRLDALMKLRATLAESGVKVSVNDMVIKAASKALRDVPEANCYYEPKR